MSRFPDELEELFEQIVLVCHEENLIGNELFAIDGCKMPSNAAKEWSGTFKELEEKRQKLRKQLRKHIRAHQQLDKKDPNFDAREVRHTKAIETLNKALTNYYSGYWLRE